LQSQPKDPAFYQSVGKAIELSRRYQDKSRRELAKKAGISYSYLSEIETGKKGPSAEALLAIAQALDLAPSELLGTAESWLEGPSLSLAADAKPSVFRNPDWLASRRGAVGKRGFAQAMSYSLSAPEPESDPASDKKRAEELLESARRLSPRALEALITRLRSLKP
jgi:transcriptional regulator with XRE-family HTH domain